MKEILDFYVAHPVLSIIAMLIVSLTIIDVARHLGGRWTRDKE